MRTLLSVLVLVLLAGCSGEPEVVETPVVEATTEATAEPTPEPTKTPTPEPTEEPGPVAPLTGEPVDEESLAELAELPVVAVKIDNDPDARPQVGLAQADVVFVEPIEGLTRLVAIFHSEGEGEVGPVRSGRRVDPKLFGAFNPIFTFSGAAGPNYSAIDGGFPNTVVNDRNQTNWRREGSRPAPHNLFITLDAIRSARPDAPGAGSDPVFAFDEKQPPGGTDIDGFTVDYGRFRTVSGWTWDEDEGWLRSQGGTPDLAGDADRTPTEQIVAANVVVLTVESTGSQVEPITVIGRGDALIHRGGQVFEGSWTKATAEDQYAFFDEIGQPLSLAPGSTWLEIHPTSGTYTAGAPDVDFTAEEG